MKGDGGRLVKTGAPCCTFTLKVKGTAALPPSSVALQVTGVVPSRNFVPDGGVQAADSRCDGGLSQLSVAVALKFTIVPSASAGGTVMPASGSTGLEL